MGELMTKLFGSTHVATPINPTDFEQALIDLAAYGQPRVSLQDNGWHCWVSMHVKALGTSVDVRSQFDHPTPREALNCCALRIQEMLRINKENQ